MLALVLTLSVGVLDAPITQVTVFTDQARVVRTAQVTLDGSRTIELPPLPGDVERSSIQVEAVGAEVRHVELRPVVPALDAGVASPDLDRLETQISRLTSEQKALTQRLVAIAKLKPAEPPTDRRLNASSWPRAMAFVSESLAQTQQRLRETDRALSEARAQQTELQRADKRAKGAEPTSGWRVVALLSGTGPCTVKLTYVVQSAGWLPTWDLHLDPESSLVTLSLSGLVSQQSGEPWSSADLVLSTAVPFKASSLPKLTSWKIGVTERFIPSANRPTRQPVRAPPPPVALEKAVLSGHITDQAGRSVPDVVVTALSTALSGEEVVVSDQLGLYRFAQLPPGAYTLKFEKESYQLLERPEIQLRADHSVRFNAQLVSSTESSETTEVVASAQPGVTVSSDYVTNIPFIRPKQSAVRSFENLASVQTTTVNASSEGSEWHVPKQHFSLSPPPAWSAPRYDGETAVAFAGGYDLTFHSVRKESVSSDASPRRVAVWSQRWPVRVERQLYPGITDEAYLVAELKNPSDQVLPGGPAQLSVGADLAGSATLHVVSPGESFTLPLGIDPAIKAVRNTAVVETSRGILSKVDLSTYTVTIEVVNPHPTPISVRVYDQWPQSEAEPIDTALIGSKPLAIADSKKGGLEWRLTLAPQQKQLISFSYSITRPQGWKLEQSL